MGKGGGPGDTLARENERIARFLARLEDLERERSATKASRTHLQKLARYDSTVSSKLHHEETDVPTGSFMVEEEHLRTLRSSSPAFSGSPSRRRPSTEHARRSAEPKVHRPMTSPSPTAPRVSVRIGRLSEPRSRRKAKTKEPKPKPKPRKRVSPPRVAQAAAQSPDAAARLGAAQDSGWSARGSGTRGGFARTPSPARAARKTASPIAEEPEPEPELKQAKSAQGGMPLGSDLGLPAAVSPDFLQPMLRQLFPDVPEPQQQRWMRRYAECGIFATQQLVHVSSTNCRPACESFRHSVAPCIPTGVHDACHEQGCASRGPLARPSLSGERAD